MSVRYTVVAILGLFFCAVYLLQIHSYGQNEIGTSTPENAKKQDASKGTCHITGLLIFSCSMISVYSTWNPSQRSKTIFYVSCFLAV